MITIITRLLIRFNDFGTGLAVVQQKDLTEEKLSSIFWLNLALGVLITILVIVCSPLVGLLYSQPAVVPLMSATALGFNINGFGIVEEALVRRHMKFIIIMRITTVATIWHPLVGNPS